VVASSSLTQRLIQRSAWKGYSANFAQTAFSEDEMRRPTHHTQYLMVCKCSTGFTPTMEGGSAHMDVSKERPKMTAGLDLGDKYSYTCA
jgi:hypothetical protein